MRFTDEQKKQLHRDASEWRHKKIKEIFNKKNPAEMEIEIINRWAEIFGSEL